MRRATFYRRAGKRAFDVVGGTLLVGLLLPLFALIAVVVLVALGRPVFFSQARPGLHGRLFRLIKFRTMTNAREPDGDLLPDAERMTRIGTWLRRSSMDELPELINVVRGEMSLVGPRPLLVEYLERYSTEQARRHDVRPGITGWAQVNGRNALTWEDRFACDVLYVDKLSFRFDLQIILKTILVVLRREGISAAGHATMTPFMGSRDPGPR